MVAHPKIAEIQQQYLSILQNHVHPFETSVSRHDIEEKIDIVQPHKKIDSKIHRHLLNISKIRQPKLQPLLGEAGSGKTHYYWILKSKEKIQPSESELQWKITYVPCPPMPIHIPLHILTCLLDEQGDWIIDATAKNLWKKFQVKGIKSKEELNSSIISYYGGVYSEIIRMFIKYADPSTSKQEKHLIKRWLFADHLEGEELRSLQVRKNISDDFSCLLLLRLFDDFSGVILIYFFDEMELINRLHGVQAEIRLWEIIKKLFNESRQTLFITTCLLNVWSRIQENLDASVISRFEPEIKLSPFSQDNAIELYTSSIEIFWNNHYSNPVPNHYFPINKKIFDVIYQKSHGNPRKIIKLISRIFDEIITSDLQPTSIVEDCTEEEISAYLKHNGITNQRENPKRIQSKDNMLLTPVLRKQPKKATLLLAQEEYQININSTSLISALITVFHTITENFEMKIEFHTNYEYKIQDETKIMPIHLENEKNTPMGIILPTNPNFITIRKAQVYFHILESSKALTRGLYSKIVLVIPPNLITKNGNIGQILENHVGELLLIEMEEKEAQYFIEKSAPLQMDSILNVSQFVDIFNFLFTQVEFAEIKEHYLRVEEKSQKIDEKSNTVEQITDIREFLLEINK